MCFSFVSIESTATLYECYFFEVFFILQKSSQSARAPPLAPASFLFAFIYVCCCFVLGVFLMCIIRYISFDLTRYSRSSFASDLQIAPLIIARRKCINCARQSRNTKKITKRFLLADSYRWVIQPSVVSGRKSVCWSELWRCSEFLSGLTFEFFLSVSWLKLRQTSD